MTDRFFSVVLLMVLLLFLLLLCLTCFFPLAVIIWLIKKLMEFVWYRFSQRLQSQAFSITGSFLWPLAFGWTDSFWCGRAQNGRRNQIFCTTFYSPLSGVRVRCNVDTCSLITVSLIVKRILSCDRKKQWFNIPIRVKRPQSWASERAIEWF